MPPPPSFLAWVCTRPLSSEYGPNQPVHMSTDGCAVHTQPLVSLHVSDSVGQHTRARARVLSCSVEPCHVVRASTMDILACLLACMGYSQLHKVVFRCTLRIGCVYDTLVASEAPPCDPRRTRGQQPMVPQRGKQSPPACALYLVRSPHRRDTPSAAAWHRKTGRGPTRQRGGGGPKASATHCVPGTCSSKRGGSRRPVRARREKRGISSRAHTLSPSRLSSRVAREIELELRSSSG